MKDLLFIAYRVQFFQLQTPAWMERTYLDIVAKVPAGATRDDLRPLLQHLLQERFALKLHSEQRDLTGYQLVVPEGGAKLMPSPPLDEEGPSRLPPKLGLDKEGFIIAPPGVSNILFLPAKDGVARLTWARASMTMFCGYLGRLLQRPVADQTGLQGVYDFRLAFAPETAALAPSDEVRPDPAAPHASDPAPTLAKAVEIQLGLKMISKKVPTQTLVIDHCERTPVEN